MLRKADELCHRSQILVEIIELIRTRTSAGIQPLKSVERAVNAAVVGEIQQRVARVAARGRNGVRERMLIRMHVGRRGNRVASIDVRKVHERRRRAGRIHYSDAALVKIDRSRVQVSGPSVGNGRQFQVVGTLLHAAAVEVAAICDRGIGNRCPRRATVQALPDAAIDRAAV